MHDPKDTTLREVAVGRTSTYLTAIAQWAGQTQPIRIRNISEFGALLQADVLPQVDDELTIEREGLFITGTVKWVKESTFGVKFHSPADLTQWVLDGEPKLSSVKEKKLTKAELECEDFSEIILARLCEEIEYVTRAVDNISSILAKDAIMCHRHGRTLQELDISRQMLTEISQIIKSGANAKCVAELASGPMKNRILR